MLMNTELNNDINELNEMYEPKQNSKRNQLIENEKLMKNKLDELGDKYNVMEINENDVILKLKQSKLEFNHNQKRCKERMNKYNNINNNYNELTKEKQELIENMNRCNDKTKIVDFKQTPVSNGKILVSNENVLVNSNENVK